MQILQFWHICEILIFYFILNHRFKYFQIQNIAFMRKGHVFWTWIKRILYLNMVVILNYSYGEQHKQSSKKSELTDLMQGTPLSGDKITELYSPRITHLKSPRGQKEKLHHCSGRIFFYLAVMSMHFSPTFFLFITPPGLDYLSRVHRVYFGRAVI